MILSDTDPLWDTFNGGAGHRDWPDWTAADGQLAADFYAATRSTARRLLDLWIDRPGELLESDWIDGQIFGRDGTEPTNGRNAVASAIRGMTGPRIQSGRRYPYKWFEGLSGAPSRYGMKHYVAALFREARGPAGEPGRKDDWAAAEVAATIDDYLAMLITEAAAQPYSKAEHRRALIWKLTPPRTRSAIEFKHQNISAAMINLGLPYIRGYLPRQLPGRIDHRDPAQD